MVYLPAGTAWKDAWTGRVAPSGTWFEAQAPLERIPVYLRDGSALSLLGET